ncbi:MAG: ABC transporter substrate-binding protein [Thermoguttaceae bacterium]
MNRQQAGWIGIAAAALLALGTLLLKGSRPVASPNSPPGKLRIVSLAPSTTEMLFALDLGDCLVGVTDCCDYPPQARRIPCVGGFGAPNLERLLALCPDLVVAAGLENPGIADLLRRSGIQVIELRIRSFEELFAALRHIAHAAGRPHQADQLVAQMQAELNALADRFATVPRDQLPRVFVELWDDPLMTVGGTSFLDEVISRAGGINVAHELPQPYPHVSPEKVIQWNPDVIVLGHATGSAKAAAQMATRIGWARISAVQHGRIIDQIAPDLMLRPGPRLIDGVKALADLLHPGMTEPGPIPSQEAQPCR